MTAAGDAPTLLFDGVCNLCDGFVRFVLRHERSPRTRFAALQSDAAADALRAVGRPPILGEPDTLVVVVGDRIYERSAASLRIAAELRWPWRAAVALRVIPRPLLDIAYRVVARNRYRWFGRRAECVIPTPELRTRFLS